MMNSDQGKLFIGGISWETSEDDLKDYFKAYGDVIEAVIMKDRTTGRARGFGFVVFADPGVADRALMDKHTINGKTVEAKKAVPRDEQQNMPRSNIGSSAQSPGGQVRTNKIFVGGLASTVTEEDFRRYFEQFGTITDVVVMYDHTTQRPRGFGFITYESEESVENVLQKNFHELKDKMVEVKRAVPKDLSAAGGGPVRNMGAGFPGVALVGRGNYGGYGQGYGNPGAAYGAPSDGRYGPLAAAGRGGYPAYGGAGYGLPGYGNTGYSMNGGYPATAAYGGAAGYANSNYANYGGAPGAGAAGAGYGNRGATSPGYGTGGPGNTWPGSVGAYGSTGAGYNPGSAGYGAGMWSSASGGAGGTGAGGANTNYGGYGGYESGYGGGYGGSPGGGGGRGSGGYGGGVGSSGYGGMYGGGEGGYDGTGYPDGVTGNEVVGVNGSAAVAAGHYSSDYGGGGGGGAAAAAAAAAAAVGARQPQSQRGGDARFRPYPSANDR